MVTTGEMEALQSPKHAHRSPLEPLDVHGAPHRTCAAPQCPSRCRASPAGVATQKAVLGGNRVQARCAAARASRPRVVACSASKGSVKKVVLAYSGGLDTSVILKWLQDTYDCEVSVVLPPAAATGAPVQPPCRCCLYPPYAVACTPG